MFQSTLPVRGATVKCPCVLQEFLVSIHAPREGSDKYVPKRTYSSVVSIHAPREGSDTRSGACTSVRRMFQSTLPVRGATKARAAFGQCQKFQSTLPVRGATCVCVWFQSTLPVRGATAARQTM